MPLYLQAHSDGLRMSKVFRHPFRDRDGYDYGMGPHDDKALPVIDPS